MEFFKRNEMARLSAILFTITAVTALLLGSVNAITKDKIAENNLNVVGDALAELIPDATFEQQDVSDDASGIVTSFYVASKDGAAVGFCIGVAPSGFGGAIETIVAVDVNKSLIGYKITKLSETPGIGTKTQDPDFIGQFAGKSGALVVVKGAAAADNEISAISGATISSTAVTTGINAALVYAASK